MLCDPTKGYWGVDSTTAIISYSTRCAHALVVRSVFGSAIPGPSQCLLNYSHSSAKHDNATHRVGIL